MYKRTLAFVLTLCMVLGMFPVTTQAAEPVEAGTFQLTYINPLYADVVTEEDLNKVDEGASAYSIIHGDVEYSTSIEEAGAVMRRRMEDRMESISISYATEDFDGSQEMGQQIMQDIFYAAVAHTGVPTQGDYLMWQHAGWKSEGSCGIEGDTYYFDLTYAMTYYTDYDQEQLVDEKVDALMDELIVPGMTDYQKIKAVYDWICANVTYDYDNLYDDSYTLKYTAYAALEDNTAVCQGYALLLYRMLLEQGIDCRLIAGKGSGEDHGWNIVELGNRYYNADSTWDAGETEYSWFLLSEESFTNHVRFGKTDYNPTDYTSDSFYKEYPMADSDYAPTEADLTPPSGGEEPTEPEPTEPEPTEPEPTEPEPTEPEPTEPEPTEPEPTEPEPTEPEPTEPEPTEPEPTEPEEEENTCGENATWHYDQQTRTLTISGTGDMYDYSTNEPPYWIEDEYPVEKVVVESGVTSIGSAAFNNMKELTEVTLPDTVESIGSMAFTMCQALETVNLPEGLTYIGEFAFDSCTSLTDIDLPESLTTVEMYAFCKTAITSVTIPAGVTRLYDFTFADCTSLKEVTLLEGLVYAGDGTFNGCSALTSITFPGTVTGIGLDFFLECTSLKEVYFLGDAPDFSSGVFAGVTTTCFYPAGNATWTADVMQNYDGTVTWKAYCPGGCAYETVVTEPTCTEPGITTHTCPNCGGSYTENPVDALGHNYVDGVCTNCGEAEVELVSPMVAAENVPETGKIKLSWEAVQGVEDYVIYRSVDKYDIDTYVLLEATEETSYVDTAAEAGTTYYYCVTARAADGTESELPQDYIVECTCDLAQPVLKAGNVASSGKVRITWEAIEGAKEYKVYRSLNGEDGWSRISTTEKTSVTNTKNCEAGKTYYYKVMAIAEDTAANSAYSAVKARTCDLPRPEISAGNTAASGKVRITWKAVDGAKEYKVYRSLNGEDGWTRISTTTSTSVTNTKNCEAGTTYYYKVMAVAEDSAANSAYSSVKARTCDLPRPLITVKNVSSSGKIRISWEAIDGAKEYKVYRSLNGEDGWKRISTTSKTSVTNTKNCEAGKTYFYMVMAIAEESAANSAYSAVHSRVCKLPRPEVELTNVESTGKNRISWEAIEGAKEYKVYRSLTGEDGWKRISTTSKTSVTNSKNCEAGETYYYKVMAVAENSAANSSYSTVKSLTCRLPRPEVAIGLTTAGQPLLDWEPVEGAAAYEIYRDTDADGSFEELIKTTEDTTYADNGARRSQTYYYRIVAVAEDPAADSAMSSPVFINCTSEDIRPSKINKDLVEAVNEYRAAVGLNELEWYTEGEMPAKIRVAELARKFDYYRPYGEEPETLWDGYDIYAECCARDFTSAYAVVDAMMEYEELAEILLYEDWTHAVAARYNNYWVIMFGF